MTDCIDRELREVVVPFLNKLLYHGRESIMVSDMKRLDALLKAPPDATKACQGDDGFPEPMSELMEALRAVWPELPDERLRQSIKINLSTDAMPILHELARTRRRVVELEVACLGWLERSDRDQDTIAKLERLWNESQAKALVPTPGEIDMFRRKPIEAIKAYRNRTGATLVDSKRVIESAAGVPPVP